MIYHADTDRYYCMASIWAGRVFVVASPWPHPDFFLQKKPIAEEKEDCARGGKEERSDG